jgi:hypothetical protein
MAAEKLSDREGRRAPKDLVNGTERHPVQGPVQTLDRFPVYLPPCTATPEFFNVVDAV